MLGKENETRLEISAKMNLFRASHMIWREILMEKIN